MGYKRNRTETLTLRLTPEEKRLLRQRATERQMSLTDYVMISALEYSDADRFRPIVKKLGDIHGELLKLRQNGSTDEICDALEKHAELYEEVLSAIKRR